MDKEQAWERLKMEIAKRTFPPRIVQELLKYDIIIEQKHIDSIVNQGKGVYFCGPVGTGKTLRAAALALAACKRWRDQGQGIPRMAFISSTGLLENIRKSFTAPLEEQDKIEWIFTHPLLILDDLGTEKVSDWVNQTLNHLINMRYENLRPTIITSNYDLKVIAQRLDDRLASRIYEMCEVTKMTGDSLRMKRIPK